MKLGPIMAAKIMGDEYNVKILSATYLRPMSVQELSILFDIPIAAAYRRVRDLEKWGLIKCVDRVLTRDNKRIRLYRSLVEKVDISFSRGKMSVRFKILDTEMDPVVLNLLKK